jgi:hypothetical protein
MSDHWSGKLLPITKDAAERRKQRNLMRSIRLLQVNLPQDIQRRVQMHLATLAASQSDAESDVSDDEEGLLADRPGKFDYAAFKKRKGANPEKKARQSAILKDKQLRQQVRVGGFRKGTILAVPQFGGARRYRPKGNATAWAKRSTARKISLGF